MNHLQKYLNLKGVSAARIAEKTGLGYHSVQKTIKGLRKGRAVRQTIADHLGLSYQQCFGAESARGLIRLIEAEIERQAETERLEARQRLAGRYLPEGADRLAETQIVING